MTIILLIAETCNVEWNFVKILLFYIFFHNTSNVTVEYVFDEIGNFVEKAACWPIFEFVGGNHYGFNK